MRTKGLVVPHSPANALLVGLDPAGGLLAGHLSGLFSECNRPGFGFLFGQLACLQSVLSCPG